MDDSPARADAGHACVFERVSFGWQCRGGEAPCGRLVYGPLPEGARTVADATHCAHCGQPLPQRAKEARRARG